MNYFIYFTSDINHLAITWSKSEKVKNFLTFNQAFFFFIFLLLFLEGREKRHEL